MSLWAQCAEDTLCGVKVEEFLLWLLRFLKYSFNHGLGSFVFLWENFAASISKSANNDSIRIYLHCPELLWISSNVQERVCDGCGECFVFKRAIQFSPANIQLNMHAFYGLKSIRAIVLSADVSPAHQFQVAVEGNRQKRSMSFTIMITSCFCFTIWLPFSMPTSPSVADLRFFDSLEIDIDKGSNLPFKVDNHDRDGGVGQSSTNWSLQTAERGFHRAWEVW